MYVTLLSLLLVAGTATAAPVTRLVVTAGGGPCFCHAVTFVGVARGIFAKYGLDVQIVTPATGFEVLKQVVNGTAQVGDAAPAVIAQMMAQGARLKGIFAEFGDATGTVSTDNFIAVIARRASGIREGHLEDLRGKRVGVPRGTDFHEYLFYSLAAKGLDAQTAVTILSTPPPGLPAALQSGSVDAIAGPLPVISQALQATSDAMIIQRGGNYVQLVELRVVSPQYLATHPGTLKRYITAFAEANQYLRMHRDEATDILTREIAGLSREAARTVVGGLYPDVRVSKVTAHAWQEGAEFALKIGALKQIPAFDEAFDIRILRQVEREHPELFGDLPPVPEALRF